MKTIKLDKPWVYRTPQTTVGYSAGEHEVADAVAAAYALENEGTDDGRIAATGAARAARPAQR